MTKHLMKIEMDAIQGEFNDEPREVRNRSCSVFISDLFGSFRNLTIASLFGTKQRTDLWARAATLRPKRGGGGGEFHIRADDSDYVAYLKGRHDLYEDLSSDERARVSLLDTFASEGLDVFSTRRIRTRLQATAGEDMSLTEIRYIDMKISEEVQPYCVCKRCQTGDLSKYYSLFFHKPQMRRAYGLVQNTISRGGTDKGTRILAKRALRNYLVTYCVGDTTAAQEVVMMIANHIDPIEDFI